MSRTIRVFISSTFTNFDDARNILVKNVFPEIREQCRKSGFSFRAVDLRWGITEDEGKNHQVADICFEEIRRCQEYSPAPNFIVLSDDYYGWIPLPASISVYCWEKIEEYLEKEDPDGLSFLQKWYRQDRNDLAGSYILQDFWQDPVEDAGSNAGDADGIEARTACEKDKAAGASSSGSGTYGSGYGLRLDKALERRISDILFPAAQAVFAEDYSLRVAFGGSMTEQEINLGLFSQKGAEEHTLVMIREKQEQGEAEKADHRKSLSGPGEDRSKKQPVQTAVEMEEIGNGELSQPVSGFNAHNLNEHLKQVMEASEHNRWIPVSEKGIKEDALAFLKEVVQKQIDAELAAEGKESAFSRECREQREALSAEAQAYIDTDGRMALLEAFAQENHGRTAVVMGGQGSGKTTLLKNYAWRNPEQCIGVFTDLQGARGTVEAALGFFTDALQQRGLLDNVVPRNPGESSAGYFERQLEGLRAGVKITLLLDCAEQVSDFRLQEESLFSINLPKGISFLVSCVDAAALSDTDRLYAPPVFMVRDLQQTDGFSMLMGMLKGYGRTLSTRQQELLCRKLPEETSPLYLRHLAAMLRHVHSFGDGEMRSRTDRNQEDESGRAKKAVSRNTRAPAWAEEELLKLFGQAGALPRDTYTLLRDSLRREAEAYLPGLSLHVFACIALSAHGIQEEELLEILRRETVLGSRLEKEIQANSHWEIEEMEHVLNIFWSRMYFQLQHFLGTYPSHGSLLVRFRHGLMKRAALEIAGRGPEFAGILEETSRAIREYWTEQDPYLLHDDKVEPEGRDTAEETSEGRVLFGTEGTPLVNRRRADELLPILLYRGEEDAISQLLEDPYHLDAMVRLNRCGNLMNDLEAAIKGGYAGSHAEAFLELLKGQEILLTSFTDSFLPLCVERGLASPGILARAGAAGFFQHEKCRATGGGETEKPRPGRHSMAGGLDDLFLQIPGCANAPIALRGDGSMAVMDRGSIRIYDWKRRRFSTARIPMEIKRYDCLYWNKDSLVLRRIKSRVFFKYEKKAGGAGEELIPGQERPCPNLLDLFADQEERRRLAGGIEEEEAAGSRTDRKVRYHCLDKTARQTVLAYPLDIGIEYYLRFQQAAVIKDREEIDFVDLESGMVRETLRIPGVTGLFYSDDGESAVIRTAADSLILHRIRDCGSHPMPCLQEGGEAFEKALRRHRFRRDFSPGILFAVRRKRDIPWQPATTSAEGTTAPTMTCLSAEGGWFACYYYYNNIACIRLFDLHTGAEILSSSAEPIYRKDIVNQPFRAAEDGMKLLLRSSGVTHVLDLEKVPPSWSRMRGAEYAPAGLENGLRDLAGDCEKHMWRWIPHEPPYESLKDLTDNTFDTALGRFGFRLWRLVFFPLTWSLMAEETNNPRTVYAPQMFRGGHYLWLVDSLYRTVHVADAKGQWLCHTQVQEPFSAADVKGDTLYLLSENRGEVRELRYVPIN